jgi:RND family efflux transporter MFP subunit
VDNLRIKKIMAIGIAGILATGVLYGCEAPLPGKSVSDDEAATEAEDESVEVMVQTPEQKNITLSSNFSATVTAESEVKVIPLISAEVVEKNFEVGDHVNEGDLLFRMDDEALQIALKQAQAQVTTAQASLKSSTATAEATKAKANVDRAQATATVGEMPYSDKQMDRSVDSAYVSKVGSNNSRKDAGDAVDLAKTTLDDYKKARDVAEKNRNEKEAAYKADPTEAKKKAYEDAEETYRAAKRSVEQAEDTVDAKKRDAHKAELDYYLSEEDYGLATQKRDNYYLYDRTTTMFGAYAQAVGANASDVGADASVTTSRASVQTAQAGLESAKLNLEHANVTAPVSGTITAINVTLHNMASTQNPAYTIQSDAPCKVVFYVAEETVKSITPGTDAVVTKNGRDYTARITNVYDTIDPDTGLFKVEAGVTGQGASDLIAGSSVSIRTITRRSDNALAVPIDSVYYDGDKPFLYVADGDTARKVYVVTGLSDDTALEITDGITASDRVIITYNGKLRDGTALKVTEAPSDNKDTGDVEQAAGAGEIE